MAPRRTSPRTSPRTHPRPPRTARRPPRATASAAAVADSTHPRRRRPARRADAAGRRAGADPQPDRPARRAARTDTDLVRASQRLNLIASELQEGVMKTRMQPIDHVWSKLPRVVRDLGAPVRQAGPAGDGGPGDRARQDAARGDQGPADPPRAQRRRPRHRVARASATAAGKPAEGVLTLRAFHEGGQVVIEVTDDGAGIDPGKLGAKAVERGLVTADQLDRMSRPRHPAADLPARASRPPRRSPTSPAAASAWTSSRPTSRPSAAPSRSSPSRGAGTTLPAARSR